MRLPDLVAYQAAVQHPSTAFADPQLRAARVATNKLGLPRAVSGNFAVTDQLLDGPQRWAVRCFHREAADRAARYAVISNALANLKTGPLIPIEYLESGVRVGPSWYPITKMAWLDGYPLNRVVESALSRPGALLELERRFTGVVAELRRRGMAHGDLQHGNILVDDGGNIHLVDYDGMFVPALKGRLASECGDPNYQHPRRSSQYDPELDRFAAIVIVVALRALAAVPALWRKYNTGDNLLFRQSDFRNPSASPLFRDLQAIPSARNLAEQLARACQQDYAQVPLLETLLEPPVQRLPSAHPVAQRTAQAVAQPVAQPRTWKIRRANVQRVVTLSADGALVATADADGRVTLREMATGRTRTTLRLRRPRIESLALGRGTGPLATTVEGSSLTVWKVTQNTPIREFQADGEVSCAALSSGGGWLAAAGGGVVNCWSVANGKLAASVVASGEVAALAVTPDGRYMAVAGPRRQVSVWQVGTGRGVAQLAVGAAVTCLTFSVDGARLLAGTARGELTLWEVATARRISSIAELPEPLKSVATTPDGKYFVASGANGSLWLRRVAPARVPPRSTLENRVTRLPEVIASSYRVFEWLRRVALL